MSADPSPKISTADWLTAVCRRWHGGRMPPLARHLAELADASAGTVDLDPPTARRLLNQVHLVPPGLARLLDILQEQGYLSRTTPPHGDHLGSYRLTTRATR